MTPRDTRDEAIETLERALKRRYVETVKQDVVEALALIRAPAPQDGPTYDFLLAENVRLKAALKEREARETQERGWQERAMNLQKHSCQSCDKTDEEFAYVDGWNDALNALLAPPAQTEGK